MQPPPSVMEDTWALSTSTVCGLQKRRHLATKSSASWNLQQLSSLAECLALSAQAAGCFSTATTKLMWTWVTGLSAKKPESCFLLRELHTLMVQFGFSLFAVHRPGALNKLADALSRNDVDTFIRLAPYPQAIRS